MKLSQCLSSDLPLRGDKMQCDHIAVCSEISLFKWMGLTPKKVSFGGVYLLLIFRVMSLGRKSSRLNYCYSHEWMKNVPKLQEASTVWGMAYPSHVSSFKMNGFVAPELKYTFPLNSFLHWLKFLLHGVSPKSLTNKAGFKSPPYLQLSRVLKELAKQKSIKTYCFSWMFLTSQAQQGKKSSNGRYSYKLYKTSAKGFK